MVDSHKDPSTKNQTHCERECNRVDCISHYATKTGMQKYESSVIKGTLRFANSPYYVHEATPSHVLFELMEAFVHCVIMVGSFWNWYHQLDIQNMQTTLRKCNRQMDNN